MKKKIVISIIAILCILVIGKLVYDEFQIRDEYERTKYYVRELSIESFKFDDDFRYLIAYNTLDKQFVLYQYKYFKDGVHKAEYRYMLGKNEVNFGEITEDTLELLYKDKTLICSKDGVKEVKESNNDIKTFGLIDIIYKKINGDKGVVMTIESTRDYSHITIQITYYLDSIIPIDIICHFE